MPTLGNCAGVGVEIPELPTPLCTEGLARFSSEPLGLGCREELRACRFCRKIKPGLGGGGDQVSYLDSDATCPRDQPTCDSGEFTNTRVSVRVDLPELMEQGAVPIIGQSLTQLLTRNSPGSLMRCDRYRWNRTALGFTNRLTARCRIVSGSSSIIGE